jgi:hypothetical protein
VSTFPLNPAFPDVARPGRPPSGLGYYVAQSLDDVLEAWRLVYQGYERDGLIDPNPFGVHTVPQAIGSSTAVVTACLGPLAVGTLSAYADGPRGLPLESVYPTEIEALRRSGRKLMEVGLFADRREHLNRSADGLFELMRYAFYFACHRGIDDVVVGVHPKHAPFYVRLLAFEKIGASRTYPTVKDNAVVLLRFKVQENQRLNPLPKGMAYFMDSALPTSTFEKRYRFNTPDFAGSPIGRFIATKASVNAA